MDTDFAKLAVEVSSFALVAWLMMQTFSKTIPTLSEQFRQDLQREREASERSLSGVTEALERLSVVLLYHAPPYEERTRRPSAPPKKSYAC